MQTKNDVIEGVGQLGKNDVTCGQAKNTGMPPNQKSLQSRVTYLSLYKVCYWPPLLQQLLNLPWFLGLLCEAQGDKASTVITASFTSVLAD